MVWPTLGSRKAKEQNRTSNVLKFADDTKLYRAVDNRHDGQKLQDDLSVECASADDWKW